MGHFDISLFLKALAHVLQAGASFGGQLLYLHTIYLITARACGQAMVGGLWTNLSTWPVDKPGYVACGQIWICGSWKNLDMWLVDKPGYIACKQT